MHSARSSILRSGSVRTLGVTKPLKKVRRRLLASDFAGNKVVRHRHWSFLRRIVDALYAGRAVVVAGDGSFRLASVVGFDGPIQSCRSLPSLVGTAAV